MSGCPCGVEACSKVPLEAQTSAYFRCSIIEFVPAVSPVPSVCGGTDSAPLNSPQEKRTGGTIMKERALYYAF